MGLFTSLCPGCLYQIDWFLHVPEGYECERCRRPVSAEEIEYSFTHQVRSNPETCKYLKKLTREEVEEMAGRMDKQEPIKSPRIEDDFYVIPGHFMILKAALDEKREQSPRK